MKALRKVLWLSVLLSVLTTTGCMRAVSEAYTAYTGPKGIVSVIQPVRGSLGDYTSFEMATFDDRSAGQVPRQLPALLPRDFARSLAEEGIPNSGGRTLLVRGQIVYYEDSERVMDQVFGPFEEVVARVELVDKASGSVLGVANCVGRSNTSVNKGVPEKAEGLAKAIASWIARNYPKSMKTK
jgi:hypothetical protein